MTGRGNPDEYQGRCPGQRPSSSTPEVRSAIDLLEAWIEAQRVTRERIETWEDR